MQQMPMDDRNDPYRRFLEEVKKALRESGRTQQDLSRMVGVSAAFISQILKGQRRASMKVMEGIAAALGISTGMLNEGRVTAQSCPAFELYIDPSLRPKQIQSALDALADYFRACGGSGLRIEFETQEATVLERIDA